MFMFSISSRIRQILKHTSEGLGLKYGKIQGGRWIFCVCGSGSGGSVTGAGKYLKMKNPYIKVICVEPAESPVISGLIKSTSQCKATLPRPPYIWFLLAIWFIWGGDRASWLSKGGEPGRHKIQGLGPGFVPQNLEKSQIDEIVMVTLEEAMTNARRLAREEGLLVGISSGANLAACLKVAAREENKGKMIVTMFPSGGERYVSSELFALATEECTKMTF